MHSNIWNQELQGQSTITSLTIVRFHAFDDPSDLLAWPAKLEQFVIEGDDEWARELNTKSFRSALSHQRDSLKYLTVSHCTAMVPINVSDFFVLKSIRLSQRTMTPSWNPASVISDVLSAPHLCRLTWDLHRVDSQGCHYTTCCDLNSEKVDWLTRVMKLAHAHGCALREVEILFWPCDMQCCGGRKLQHGLDLLDGFEKGMEGLGIKFIFQKYCVVRNKRKDSDSYSHAPEFVPVSI